MSILVTIWVYVSPADYLYIFEQNLFYLAFRDLTYKITNIWINKTKLVNSNKNFHKVAEPYFEKIVSPFKL